MTIPEYSSPLQLHVNIGDGNGGVGHLEVLDGSFCGQTLAETCVLCLFNK